MDEEAYEVELKFRVESHAEVEQALQSRDAALIGESSQCDQYYRHPARDFAKTDEALRIRSTESNAYLTYKGPKLDQKTKTRREIELPIGLTAQADFDQLLVKLGFTPVAAVRKRRREYSLDYAGRAFKVALDDVAEIGLFVEIETISDQASLTESRDGVLMLAGQLGLTEPTRLSYLRYLLAARGIE